MTDLDVIEIEEISVEKSDDFFEKQMQYLLNDKMFLKEEDATHFSGEEYRNTLKEHMIRETDKHHMIYFKESNQIIGAAQYTTYQSEDGKCFILDFWVFPEYRGKGKGKECFNTLKNYTKK
ncbi:MAG: GNAT family N-acetyltransferase, partial [Candidatus Delongbacteria bacterium]